MVRALLALLWLPAVLGVTVFSDNFNTSPLSASWVVSGTVSLQTSPRLGTSGYSLRTSKDATITRTVSTVGYSAVSVTVNLAAQGLESADYCVAEYSTDNGAYFTELLRVTVDSGAFFSATTALPAAAENNAVFQVRYRGVGDLASDYCHAEDITVSGTVFVFPAPPAPVMQTTYDTLSGTGVVSRTLLTYTQLTTGASLGAPVDNSAFAVPATAAHPTNFFQGPLNSVNQASVGSSSVVYDAYGYISTLQRTRLPKIYHEFVQHGSHILPAIRTYQLSSHPSWEYIFSPGRVWNENSDNGYSRVAIPFSLTQRNANCVHYGVMSFLFKNGVDGVSISAISSLYYQITQETCAYFKANLWGTVTISATTAYMSTAAAVRSAYEVEVSGRVTVKPIASLATDFPGTDVTKFSAFITPAHMTAFGFYIDGTHYSGGYQTRYGAYPYPATLPFPSYSTAKSFFASAGAMRMSQKYPALSLYSNFVNSRVPSCPAAKWGDVTVSHCLDMTTGNYGNAGYEVDEASGPMESGYFLKDTNAARLNFMCNNYARKATPGSTWVYHTIDSNMATVALQQVVTTQEPATVSIGNFMYNELWSPLGLSPLTAAPKVTYDSVKQAWGGYGMFITADDYVKIGRFMNDGEGKIGGVQKLDYSRLKMALQRDPANNGLAVVPPSAIYPHRYKASFWAKDPYGGAYSSCGVSLEPYMSGYGGISVVLLKNKAVYFAVSDNSEYDWSQMAIEASSKIRSPCSVSYTP